MAFRTNREGQARARRMLGGATLPKLRRYRDDGGGAGGDGGDGDGESGPSGGQSVGSDTGGGPSASDATAGPGMQGGIEGGPGAAAPGDTTLAAPGVVPAVAAIPADKTKAGQPAEALGPGSVTAPTVGAPKPLNAQATDPVMQRRGGRARRR